MKFKEIKDKTTYLKREFIDGAKWMQERMYSEEEVYEILAQFVNDAPHNTKEWFEQFKKGGNNEKI